MSSKGPFQTKLFCDSMILCIIAVRICFCLPDFLFSNLLKYQHVQDVNAEYHL